MDYDEVFAPVAKHATIRFILSMAADPAACLAQLDFSTAFLNREVLVDQGLFILPGPTARTLIWVILWVDDFLLLSFHKEIPDKYKQTIKTRDLGEPSVFGCEITRDRNNQKLDKQKLDKQELDKQKLDKQKLDKQKLDKQKLDKQKLVK
eukprot:gene31401-biopygen6262